MKAHTSTPAHLHPNSSRQLPTDVGTWKPGGTSSSPRRWKRAPSTPSRQPHGDSDDLVRACQRNPENRAFARALHERHKALVLNLCLRMTGDANLALDAAQETFAAAFRQLKRYRFEAHFSSWLYRIAINSSIDQVRRARSHASCSLVEEGARTPELEEARLPSPPQALARRERAEIVQAAISCLPLLMRQVVCLRYMEGLSYADVSETLGISLGTVKSRLFRAHEALERTLTPDLAWIQN